MRIAGFIVYRTHAPMMATHWGDSWLYGGLVVAFGVAVSFPGWPPLLRRDTARARRELQQIAK